MLGTRRKRLAQRFLFQKRFQRKKVKRTYKVYKVTQRFFGAQSSAIGATHTPPPKKKPHKLFIATYDMLLTTHKQSENCHLSLLCFVTNNRIILPTYAQEQQYVFANKTVHSTAEQMQALSLNNL
jgi:hypothetical protein